MSYTCLAQLLEHRATSSSQRLFVSAPEDDIDVTYGLFYQEAQVLACRLQALGLRPGDRVALILGNGLHWVTAFWSIMLAGAVAVPLNPSLTPGETAGLLADAGARLIITDDVSAKALPIALANQLTPLPAAGAWRQDLLAARLFEHQPAQASGPVRRKRDDEALLLFTSGSTGRPKGVVLTHGNLLAEAGFIRQGHQLGEQDIVLCILPFFHINGLVITLITPLLSGGRIVVPHKFSAGQFWHWAQRYQATWFSAVPTILSILLSRQGDSGTCAASLRFARSASSSLPVAILHEFEKRYRVPVIEAYGLSETGSQVATNPLPPAVRKAGSVGLPVGNQIGIVDETGHTVPAGTTGEVVICGDNVTPGYLNNPEANRESFKDGWFYTGDLGYFDDDGYLFLNGRRKELINRAGEKISPREVDEVLYRLPEIEVAAAVGVPDKLFGEEIVAFVQLRPDTQLSADRVISHCSACLAGFKVPKRIFYIDDFPKGPNGKVQRRRLVDIYIGLVEQDAVM